MMLSTIFAGLTALAAVAGAQSTGDSDSATSSTRITTASATSTSSSATVTHSVSVGAEGYKFTPQTVSNASVGDIIEFRFYPTGHSVVRSEYKYPCIPYEYTGANKVGFFSGFENVATITNDGPTFSVRVNDTAPIWLYCAAPGSCIDNWMIGVINPNATQTLDVQLEYTKNTTVQVVPGDPLPSETASGGDPGATSTSSSGSDNQSHSSAPLSAGAIAGIAIGGAVVLLIAATLLYLCGRRGGLDKAYNRQSRHAMPPPMGEVKYNPGAKSPGQETFATTTYSVTPSNDPYQHQQQQGHSMSQGVPGYSVHSGSPPPMSIHSQNSYQHFGNAPGMSPPYMQGGTENGGSFNVPQRTGTPGSQPQHQNPHAPPVELPTSTSPLQTYSGARAFSWSTGGERTNRSSKPA
ncbi:hypothetical protein diail_7424 [Diaporthe ilicicola]|nr:hypothetical protein diail_7424 [Diaporthe ilicicola]